MTKTPRVLVVDDNDDHRYITVRELQRMEDVGRFQIGEANNGREALRILEGWVAEKVPIQVLSDFRMPTMTGLELLQAAQARFPRAGIRFVIFSSMEQATVGQQSLQLGADFFFVKPIELDRFRAELRNLLRTWLRSLRTTPGRAR